MMNLKAVSAASFRRNAYLRAQRGDALVSTMIALTLIAIIASGAYMMFQDSVRKNEVKDTVALVTGMAGEMRQKFGQSNQYASVTTAIAVQSRAIPANLRITGTNTAQNMWGGTITVAPVTLSVANDALALTFNRVPQGECMDIVVGTQTTARRIRVGGTVVKATDATLNLATLATQCETASNVAVEWAIGRTGA